MSPTAAFPCSVSTRSRSRCTMASTISAAARSDGMRSHEGSTLIAMATALEMGFTREDTGLMVMPMCHANSLYFSHTFAHLGASCVIDDRQSFDAEALLATLASEKVTFTSLVPTHYIMMLGLPQATRARYDVAAVEKLMTDRLIGDVATAAKVYKIEAAETAEAAAPPRMGPAPIEWPQNRFKGLTENPNQWARTEAYAALQDIQQGKVSA